MSRPWKHPKTGICWFRKRVPGELRALLGKTEEKQSLGTRDPSEAKFKQAEVLVAFEKRCANLKVGPRSLREPRGAGVRPVRSRHLARPLSD
jgi:hypothetical protein